MEYRVLGSSGLKISPIGLGCMGITHASGAPMGVKDGINVIRKALEVGYTLFDTAECYTGISSDGSTAYNEEIVGEALRDVRDKVVIATKFGVRHGSDRLIVDSRRETIRKSVEGSLFRLRTDYIDLYYQHRIDPKVEPEEVAGTMAELIKEGKIRYWGISEVNESYLRRAHAVCPVTAIQNRYSMMARKHESLFPVMEELNIAFVAFSPLANGFLSGRYDKNSQFEQGVDYRSFMPQYTTEGFERNKSILELLRGLAAKKDVTPAQISLAWMLRKHDFIIPIPGSRKIERLQENFRASDIELDKDEITMIDSELNKMNFLIFCGH